MLNGLYDCILSPEVEVIGDDFGLAYGIWGRKCVGFFSKAKCFQLGETVIMVALFSTKSSFAIS